MAGDDKKDVVKRVIDSSFNRGDFDTANGLMSEDYVEHLSTPHGAVIDRDGTNSAIAHLRQGFPDIEFTVEEIVGEGDIVAARNVWHGTNTGPFMGRPPTGKRVTVTAMGFNRVVDGKLVEHWGQIDMLGLMQQLGVIPAGGGPPGAGGPPGGGPPGGGHPGPGGPGGSGGPPQTAGAG